MLCMSIIGHLNIVRLMIEKGATKYDEGLNMHVKSGCVSVVK